MREDQRIQRLFYLLFVLIFWVGSTLVANYFNVDITIAQFFYDSEQGWYLQEENPWIWLYEYGTIPGLLFTLFSLFGIFWSHLAPRRIEWKKPCLIVFLTSVLGAGLLVNAILKENTGKPRPRQIQTFGGPWEYQKTFDLGIPGKGHSFPCGHCTMGYIFVTLIYFRSQIGKIAYLGATLGLFYGLLMSVTRIIQGAHFASDAFWSLGIILMLSNLLSLTISEEPKRVFSTNKTTPLKRILTWSIFSIITLAIVLSFLTRRPFYRTYPQAFVISEQITNIQIHVNQEILHTRVEYKPTQRNWLYFDIHGFGFPTTDYSRTEIIREEETTLHLKYDLQPIGYFSEIEHSARIIIDPKFKNLDIQWLISCNETSNCHSLPTQLAPQ